MRVAAHDWNSVVDRPIGQTSDASPAKPGGLLLTLERRGVPVEAEKWDGHKHIDLVVSRAMLNIEVDGKQHYEDWRQILSDLHRTHHSDRRGWDTVHIPNAVIENQDDLQRVADALAVAARVRAGHRGHRMHWRHYEHSDN